MAVKPAEFAVGENVSYTLEGDTLSIRIPDITHRATDKPLEGKKTIRVASTLGNVTVQGTKVVISVNAYVYPEA